MKRLLTLQLLWGQADATGLNKPGAHLFIPAGLPSLPYKATRSWEARTMDRQTSLREVFHLMLKKPERGIKMLKENGEIPHFFFLPSILSYHSSKTSPMEVYRRQNPGSLQKAKPWGKGTLLSIWRSWGPKRMDNPPLLYLLCLHATWPSCGHSHRSAWHCTVTEAPAFLQDNWKKETPKNCKAREVTEREKLGKVSL